MSDLFQLNPNYLPFQLFSWPHIMTLIITVLLLICLYKYKFYIKTRYQRLLRYTLIAILITGEVAFHLWYIYHDKWSIQVNLPLQISTISMYLGVIMLLTRNQRVFEVTFFIGTVGATFAMITPELFFGFPHMRFFHFFIVHIAIIIANFYMVWIEGFQATWRSIVKAFFVLNIIAAMVFTINHSIDANYMFLNQAPRGVSLIDVLGPYPWYILSLEAIALLSFTVIYIIVFKRP